MTAAGVITSVSVPTCSVQIGSSAAVTPGIPLARHLHAAGAVQVGDACVVETTPDGQAWVTAVLGLAPAPPPPPPEDDAPPAPPVITTGSQTFPPTSTGTWRGSSWRTDTTDVIQGKPTSLPANHGGAWYGGGVAALKGTITGARVRLRRVAGGVFAAQQLNMRLLAGSKRPGGAPTVIASAAGPSLAVPGHGTSETWWTIPSSWLDDFDDGDSGIGIEDNPYVRLTAAGGGMTLVVDWRLVS